jgi:uncharacterized membrane protein
VIAALIITWGAIASITSLIITILGIVVAEFYPQTD